MQVAANEFIQNSRPTTPDVEYQEPPSGQAEPGSCLTTATHVLPCHSHACSQDPLHCLVACVLHRAVLRQDQQQLCGCVLKRKSLQQTVVIMTMQSLLPSGALVLALHSN